MEEIKLSGFLELDRKLHELPVKVGRKILRQATVEAAKVIQVEADRIVRSKAKIRGGQTVRIVTSQREGGSKVTCKITATKKRWYLKFLETGTVVSDKAYRAMKHTGRIARRLQLRGKGMWHITPKPWLRPAMDSQKMKALDVLGKGLGSRIEAEAKI